MWKRFWFLVAVMVGMVFGGGGAHAAGSSRELLASPILGSNSLAAAILRSSLALTNGQSPPPTNGSAYSAFSSPMQYSFGKLPSDPNWTNWVYTRNTNFWLNGVRGLDALNVFPYQMQLTLVTPRHCLTVAHMQGCGSNVMVCFVGTNNTIYWRRSLGMIAINNRLRACILDAPVPVPPMPLMAGADLAGKLGLFNGTRHLDTEIKALPVILFNQQWQAWVGDMTGASVHALLHQDRSTQLGGWSWAVPKTPAVVGGDSGSARCLVLNHQLYLIGVAMFADGDTSMYDIGEINASLDKLSAQTRQPRNHVTVFDASAYPSYTTRPETPLTNNLSGVGR
jgi:hypothetical protein